MGTVLVMIVAIGRVGLGGWSVRRWLVGAGALVAAVLVSAWPAVTG